VGWRDLEKGTLSTGSRRLQALRLVNLFSFAELLVVQFLSPA
jgi:hypothetical protein